MKTLAEAAALLGLSPSTLRGQVKNGRLRARKVGRDWTVSEQEVERYRATSYGRPGRPARHYHDSDSAETGICTGCGQRVPRVQ